MLALELLTDPPVLLLDEPTAGLDLVSVAAVRSVIQDYARDRAVVMATHHPSDVEAAADSVVVLSHGAVTWRGSFAELVASDGSGTDQARSAEAALLELLGEPPASATDHSEGSS